MSTLKVNAIQSNTTQSINVNSNLGNISNIEVAGVGTFSGGVVISSGSTSAPSISPSGDSNTGIFFPAADTIAFAEGGVEALRIDSSANIGIGTANPTSKLHINGTTKVETSIGSTQSIWFNTLDSKSYSAPSVDLLVQPETAYSFDSSQTAARFYEPTIFSHALTSANGSYNPTLYSLQNHNNVAGTTSNARINVYGFWNQVTRNSTTDVSSYASNVLSGSTNFLLHGVLVDQSVVTGFAYGSQNTVTIRKATATNIYTNYNQTNVGVSANNSASSTNAYGSYNIMQVGAASGTGIGTITNYYGYYVAPTVALTGQLTNYYGLYLATPIVSGTLTNRYSIYSSDTSSPMYHAGSVGIGTAVPSQKLEVVGGEIKAGRVDSTNEGGQVSFGRATDNATGWYIDVYGNTSTPSLRFVDVSNASVRATIDGSGRITTPNQPVFKAYRSASTSASGVIAFNNVIYNVGSSYNSSNGLFTAPVAGYYIFFFLSIGSGSSNTFRDVWGSVNGTTTPSSFGARPTNQTTDYSSSGSASNIVYLNANDTFGLYASGSLYSDSNIWLQFGGYLLG